MASIPVFVISDPPSTIDPLLTQEFETAGTRVDRPTVLLVDDEHRIVDTLAMVLEQAGFRVIPAYSGAMALEKAANVCPEFLLSDVLMPKMNGVELAIAIQKMYPTTRVVLFSGQAGISDILLEGQKKGFEFELIAKPMHPLKIIEHLKRNRTEPS